MAGSDWVLGGPLFWVLTAVLFVAGMLAAFIIVDSVRRSRIFGSRPAEPVRWAYIVPQAAYLALLLAGQVGVMPMAVTAAVVLATPAVLVQGVVYLLRVVFPKPVDVPDADTAQE